MTVVNYFPLSVMKLGSMYTGTSEEHFCIDSKLIAVTVSYMSNEIS